MEFTYNSYEKMLINLVDNEYTIASYCNWKEYKKCVILRHDIDYSPQKALVMAQLEHDRGVSSTYFVLVTSDLYNIFSAQTSSILKTISSLGHEIGLHFDEVRYDNLSVNETVQKITEEAKLLEKVVGNPVKMVSMHRPSKMILDADLTIPGIINSYGSDFFKGFKYLSDSRRRWREPVEEIICSGEFQRLHILTHAFWYEQKEVDIHRSIRAFVNHANKERYSTMSENITDIGSIMELNEVLYE